MHALVLMTVGSLGLLTGVGLGWWLCVAWQAPVIPPAPLPPPVAQPPSPPRPAVSLTPMPMRPVTPTATCAVIQYVYRDHPAIETHSLCGRGSPHVPPTWLIRKSTKH